MPSDPVELTKQIKAASDIVAVVGSYLTVKPAGTTFKALCPFHQDSRPSLDIDPKRQRYKCWFCGAFGDAFNFVQHMEKVGFIEARAILAQRAGIKLDESESPQNHHRSRLREVIRWAQEKYHHALLEDEIGEAAVKYIAGRKLMGKTVREFGLGFAPLNGDWLTRLAEREGISDEFLVEVGLIAARQEGRGYYDRFRDRVMFPIKDVRGQVIAFGGRIMPESPYASRAPKYYNSAETPLFSKSDVLYGLDLARHAGAAAGYLAVVEGYTDVMMAHQSGIQQVVATMGTALNSRHVAQLRRYVPKVVLVYDADAGGITGVDRALEIFVSQDVELAVATLPDGLDPCDLLVQNGGVETFQQILASAKDALDFKLNTLLEREGASSVEGTRRVIDAVLGIMAAAPTLPSQAAQVKQELIVTRLGHRLGVRQETIWARFGELKKERQRNEQQAIERSEPPTLKPGQVPLADSNGSNAGQKENANPNEFLAKTLLRLLIAQPELVATAMNAIEPEEIEHSGIRRLIIEMYAVWNAGQIPDLDVLRERMADHPKLYDALVNQAERGHQINDRAQKLRGVIADFQRVKVETEVKRLTLALKTTQDPDEKRELLRQLQQTYEKKKNAG